MSKRSALAAVLLICLLGSAMDVSFDCRGDKHGMSKRRHMLGTRDDFISTVRDSIADDLSDFAIR